MTSRNARFNSRLLSLERHLSERMDDLSISDGGRQAAALRRHLDESVSDAPLADDVLLLATALWLKATGRGHLVAVLRLIAQNGSDRERSIRGLMRRQKLTRMVAERKYFRHLHALLTYL